MKRIIPVPPPPPVEERLDRIERLLAVMRESGLELELIDVLHKHRRLADVQSLEEYQRACVDEIDAVAMVVAAILLDEPAMRGAFDAALKHRYADGKPLVRLSLWSFVPGHRLEMWRKADDET